LIALAGALAWGVVQIARTPEITVAAGSPADGLRAQQKLFDVMRRAGSGRPHTATLSDREINAFLSRHLGDAAGLPLRNLAVRLPADGHAEVTGQLPVRQLLGVAPLSGLTAVLPDAWLDHPVWITVLARVTLEGGARDRRYLRLDVERFWLGRQRLPELMMRVLLDPAALRILRWPVPDAIEGIRIEPGRLVIQSAA
jgi:hypothetical protein